MVMDESNSPTGFLFDLFEDLDYFCGAYKMMFAKCVPPLKKEVARILERQAAQQQMASPY